MTQKITANLLLSFILLSVTACKFSDISELFYFNRVKYVFVSDDQESQAIFMCKKGASTEDVAERANKANQAFQAHMRKVMDEFEKAFRDILAHTTDDAGVDVSTQKLLQANLTLQDQIEKKIRELEETYHCMLIDTIDLAEKE